MNVRKIIENKYVYYLIVFLAILNLCYLIVNNKNGFLFFFIVGFIASCVSKNIVVILFSCIFFTCLLFPPKEREGLKNVEDKPQPNAMPLPAEKKEKNDVIIPLDDKAQDLIQHQDILMHSSLNRNPVQEESSLEEIAGESFESMKKYSNSNIDYATTIENAYDDLSKILGDKGIRQLTADTQRLMEKQKELAQSMKSMTPLLDQAKTFLQGFDIKNIKELGSFANFTPST